MEAASKAGLRAKTWHIIENGTYDPFLSHANRIAKALGTNISVLLQRKE